MMGTFRSSQGVPQEVVLVQGNATLAEKRDLASARQNLVRIFDLSTAVAHPDTLVVWPEGSVPAYIPATIGSVGYPPILPWIGNGSAFLVGSYSFLPNEERFNAAFAVYPDGDVPMPYFKRVLIPFGEYMPLASYFSRLKELNAKAGVFSAGTKAVVFAYPMHRPDGTAYTLKVSPLDLLRGYRPGPGPRVGAAGGRAPGEHHVRLLVRPHAGPAPASPDRRVPGDREPALPDPGHQHGPECRRRPARQDHRPNPSLLRRDRDGASQALELSERLYQLGRRPPLVGPPRVEHRHGCREAMARGRCRHHAVGCPDSPDNGGKPG